MPGRDASSEPRMLEFVHGKQFSNFRKIFRKRDFFFKKKFLNPR